MNSRQAGPISDNYYHDCELFGIVNHDGQCLLMLRDPERGNERFDISLHGVELLYAKNFLQGNIIFDIQSLDVTEENFNQVLGMLQDPDNPYMNDFENPRHRADYRQHYVGKRLVLLSSSYGASLVCVCASISETRPA